MQTQRTLDTALLGRPLQAFDAMAQRIALHLTAQLQQSGHRHVALHVLNPSLSPWRPHSRDAATPAITLARATVQELMAARYGFAQETDSADSPASATELRITAALEHAISDAVDAVLPANSQHPATEAAWLWQAEIRVGDAPAQPLRVRLQPHGCAALEHYAASQRRWRSTTETAPCALSVDVLALLLEKTVTAADIQQLQVGSVLPIALERACVHLNGQPMLSASVAEHQGTLHLTAFETLE